MLGSKIDPTFLFEAPPLAFRRGDGGEVIRLWLNALKQHAVAMVFFIMPCGHAPNSNRRYTSEKSYQRIALITLINKHLIR